MKVAARARGVKKHYPTPEIGEGSMICHCHPEALLSRPDLGLFNYLGQRASNGEGQQTNQACHLFLKIKFYWNKLSHSLSVATFVL